MHLGVRRLAAVLAILVAGAVQAAGAPYSAEELFREPRVRGVDVSPDGAHVALAFRADDQPGDVIGVIQTSRLGQADAVSRFALGEKEVVSVDWLSWATPNRLLIGISLTSRVGTISATKRGRALGTRVYAVNRDGSEPRVLFSNASNVARYGFNLSTVLDAPANDPNHVLMPGWTGVSYDLFRVNIHTGIARRIADGNRHTYAWDAEDGRAALRYDINRRGTVVSVYGRAADSDEWALLTRYKRNVDKLDWNFAGDAPGAGKIYVRTRRAGADAEGIYQYDIAKKAIETLIAAAPGYDMQDALIVNGKYLGASYIGDRLTYVLADPQLQKHLNGIDAFFRGDANVEILSADDSGAFLLLFVVGPTAPGDYYLYDVKRANLQFLMSARPWLQPERLASMEARRTPTRDGREITTYLTWPSGGGRTNLPALVMPHGGPELRDFLNFDAFAQAFAAQGWLVVQPNFRGSGGYGAAFAEAGHRQWSKRMTDDVTDAVRHLIDKGVVDRSRIAICGASYGGYAALAGAVSTPGMYRAVVSIAGITDLTEMLNWQREQDGADSESYAYWVRAIGDPRTDAADLRAGSPRLRAGEIRVPVLLMHGAQDSVVPIEQSQMMEQALKATGGDVRMITYENEVHSGWSYENEVSSTQEIIEFLKPHLSAAKAP
jgi:dipeptidyl aminopeptidase/acylaminoacyl peptidase